MVTAYVNLWDKRVGAVLWDADLELASFEYDPNFIRQGLDIAPIMMPLEEKVIYAFSNLSRTTTFKGLPGLLADALPDKYGNTLINEWLVRNGREMNSLHPVEMLSFVGNRGMGAVEFEPVNPRSSDKSTRVEISSLIDIARSILNAKESFRGELTADKEKALLDILKIGTSAGGARAKALIAYNETTKEVRSGQADAPQGFLHWLIKFDGVHDSQFGETYGYGHVEMAYYLMAIDAGIEMMPSMLFEEHERGHFMTRRFDRMPGKGKIHVQTWCAMTHRDFQDINSFSYEELFQTMRILGLPYPDAEQLFRRMVFNVIARNCDDHTKNFAFLMDKDGQWGLSPAYDVCHAYRPDSVWVSRHCLSINGKRDEIGRADLITVAKQMNIRKADGIISEIQSVVNRWEDYAKKVQVKVNLKKAIGMTLLKI
ncbi:type II toxin-antitoxin system HipA family toxin [Pedobacter frigidisoli]|uniref:Type II toxin-antitoxin system HipA family toxin n=1 Tax=Pedobacter frigidisoli TaxID=2530455 RepID=A0A4R0NYW0_9SPHI|nr:type II toxin-antitoxin system HipA family toxin [Pedobacter frigidisoli]TCD07650.1 type II toxin-antitoxin system HipA family toxin [Pedobacter frigidisoli]